MEQMQQANMSWIEVQFLRKAVDVLSECRRTLMYTYAFAFYLQKDNQSEIFEDNQRDLEHATEQLSEFLERDLVNENLVSLKQKVGFICSIFIFFSHHSINLKYFLASNLCENKLLSEYCVSIKVISIFVLQRSMQVV